MDIKREPTEADCAYLAGLIDADGYIGMSVARPGGARKSPSFRVRVKISMCDRRGIDLARSCFGGPVPKLRARKNPKHRAIWEWTLCGGAAAVMLKRLIPYLLTKRKQASLCIEMQARNNRFELRGGRGVKSTSKGEVLIRAAFHREIQNLNARGS